MFAACEEIVSKPYLPNWVTKRGDRCSLRYSSGGLGNGMGVMLLPVCVTVLLAYPVDLFLVVVIVRQCTEHLSRR